MNLKNINLTLEEIKSLSSPYIPDGIRQDVWKIDQILVKDGLAQAKASFDTFYNSPTDGGGAHLSIFSANEIVSQIMVIYVHLVREYKEKCREVWVVDIQARYLRPIRDLVGIDFKMHKVRTRSVGMKLYCQADWVVTGKCGGRFEVCIRGFMD